MTDGVKFTITTVEFQDGPYQGANKGEPLPVYPDPGDPGGPVVSTSDPTTETGGSGGSPLTWAPLGLKLRLGGSGRAALVLDPADVDLRQKLAASTVAIATETDLADLVAIQGLYPVVAEPTLRTGTINFQLIVTAPAGEQVSADGITWGSTASFEATASTALIQDPDAANSTDANALPISIARTVQRRQSGYYRDTDVDVSGDVLTQMINPSDHWQVISGATADAAGFPYALEAMPPDWFVYPDDSMAAARSGNLVSGSADSLIHVATWTNVVAVTAEPVVTAGSGATPEAAVDATSLQTEAVTVTYTASGGDVVSIPFSGGPNYSTKATYSGVCSIDLQTSSGSILSASPTESQLAQLSTDAVKIVDVRYFVPTVNVNIPSGEAPLPFDVGSSLFAVYARVALQEGATGARLGLAPWGIHAQSVAIYIAKSFAKADWPT